MATTNLKLVTSQPDAIVGRRAPRPFTTYYFTHGKRSPIRVARSSSPAAAVVAVVRRVMLGEAISVAEVLDSRGKLLRTVKTHYGKITITR